jgi:hypothetical protein
LATPLSWSPTLPHRTPPRAPRLRRAAGSPPPVHIVPPGSPSSAPLRARTTAMCHRFWHRRAHISVCFPHLKVAPIPPLGSPGAAHAMLWPCLAAASPEQRLQRPPTPTTAAHCRRSHPDPNSGHKPSLGAPLGLPHLFPDRELHRSHRIPVSRTSEHLKDHIACILFFPGSNL